MKQYFVIFGVLISSILYSSKFEEVFYKYSNINIQNKKDIQPFIDQLKPNESLTIAFNVSGCFTDTLAFTSMKIKRVNNGYFVFYKEESKKITGKEINFIKKFENELDLISTRYKCTTNAYYLLRYNKLTKNRIDNTCSWHGFEKLIKNIFY